MKKLLMTFSMAAFIAGAMAQTEVTGEEKEFQDKVASEAAPLKHVLIQNSYSPFKGKLSSFLTKVSVSSTFNAGENARADLSYVTNKDSNFVIGISVDQRIGGSARQATPFDLAEGLSAGTTAGFNLSYIHWKPKLSKQDFDNFNRAADTFAARRGLDRRFVVYSEIKDSGTAAEKNLLPRLKNPIFFNLKVAFTKTGFSYATDSVSLTQIDDNYITPDINFSIGILSSMSSYLAIGYSYSKVYYGADEVTFTSPFGTSGNFLNQTIAFGAPQKETDSRLSIQWSKLFGKSSAIGIAPSFTYGFTSKMAALTLPIYFIKGAADGKPNGLQGGIQLGYVTSTGEGSLTSFKDGFGAQLLIGIPFDVFGALQ